MIRVMPGESLMRYSLSQSWWSAPGETPERRG
jgi:hypothetical protein